MFMNFKKFFSILTVALFIATIFTSCSDDDKKVDLIKNPLGQSFYILNRGNWNANDATIAYYNADTQQLTGDIYKAANNGDKLGDSAQDMIIYGDYMYVTVYGSNRLVKLDLTGKLIASIEPKDENDVPLQPRSLIAYNNKLYVSYYSGHCVAVLDCESLKEEAIIPVGRYPEQLVVANQKLYVANSGGMDYPNYGNTVSIVDLSTKKVVTTVDVEINPCGLQASSNGNVYVTSLGDYSDAHPNTLQVIKSGSTTAEKLGGGTSMSLTDDQLYVLYSPYYTPEKTVVRKYNAKTAMVENENLIPAIEKVNSLTGITAQSGSGNIFVTNAPYGSDGNLFVYEADGELFDDMDTKGAGPQKVCFVTK